MRTVTLHDPAIYRDDVPFEYFAELRRTQPVAFVAEADGPGYWSVVRHRDVVQVSRDWETFSSHRGGTQIADGLPDALALQQSMMLNMDPPLHSRYRRLISKGFTPRMVSSLETMMKDRARSIIDSICLKGSCELVADVSCELPVQVIADILGVPQHDRHLIFEWSDRLVGRDDPDLSDEASAAGAAAELYAYVHDLALQRRDDPRDDIVSILVRAEVDGHALTDLELDMFFLLLTVAGNETTRNAISHGLLALMEHPDQRQLLLDDPALMPTAVEEILRWASPVLQFRRTAVRDTEIGGQRISAGDKVVIWYVSANRDEDVFDQPDRFDVRRSPNEQISFGGGGPHFCLGANLARLELTALFSELLPRLPDMELDGPVVRVRSSFIRGISKLPVRFTPTSLSAAPA